MHHAIGALAIVGLIAFAFGERTARMAVAGVLITIALAFAYVMFRIVSGTI